MCYAAGSDLLKDLQGQINDLQRQQEHILQQLSEL